MDAVPATVLGGVPASRRNLGRDGYYPDARPEAQWAAVYRALDVISPWSVGMFTENKGADSFARLRLLFYDKNTIRNHVATSHKIVFSDFHHPTTLLSDEFKKLTLRKYVHFHSSLIHKLL
jgi:hypothetical protein